MPVNLTCLSDKELLSSAKKIRQKEHDALLDMLAHINEIDRRRLYLPLSYSSSRNSETSGNVLSRAANASVASRHISVSSRTAALASASSRRRTSC